MIDPKFHLQPQADKNDCYPILMLFSVNGKRLQYYSGLKAPSAAKPVKGKDKPGKYPFKEFQGSAGIKTKLEALRSHAKAIENDLIAKGLPQSVDVYKEELDKRFKGRSDIQLKRAPSIEDHIVEYLIKVKSEHTYNSFKNCQTSLNHFRNFLGRNVTKLAITEVNDEMMEDYRDFMKDGRLNNTVVKAMHVLRSFLIYCQKKKYIQALPHLETGTPNNITVIHLSHEEVMKMAYTPMPSLALERVRDFFVFGSFTGMRYGDIAGLKKSNCFQDRITFFNQKNGTTQTLTVPLTAVSKSIIEKYKDTPGDFAIPSISNQKTNDHLKEVARYAGLDSVIEIANKDGYGKIHKEHHKKWELISCHTCRKSFITIAMTLGMPESVIISITGHTKGSKAFHKYYDVVNQTKFDQMAKVFNF